MDNWFYYIVLAGFLAISKAMENRRKEAKKKENTAAPSVPKRQKKRPSNPNPEETNFPETLEDVFADIFGRPKPQKPQPKAETTTGKETIPQSKLDRENENNRIPSTPPSAPYHAQTSVPSNQVKIKANHSAYERPKSVAEDGSRKTAENTRKRKSPVNLRQAVIYQTILERKYS